MRRRVDEGNFGQPPAAAVRGEVLVMYDAGLLPGLPPMVADGVHTVNDDMPPGRYVIWDVAECSWERRDSDGDVLANNFIRLAGRAEVDIRSYDHEFSSDNCGRWIKLDEGRFTKGISQMRRDVDAAPARDRSPDFVHRTP